MIRFLRLSDIDNVEVRLATEADSELDAYDNTRLTALNTCPTWGIVRYSLRKRMPGSGRAMALEAGSACHEVFAAARVYQLGIIDGHRAHMHYHGERIFGENRYESMVQHLDTSESPRTQVLNFCLEALYSCGFYDDPGDPRRTLSNLEEACIAYLDREKFNRPIWVADPLRPTAPVGIEVPFNLVIKFTPTTLDPKGEWLIDENSPPLEIRFIGRVDGVHVHPGKKEGDASRTVPHENKTGSRINDAWSAGMLMSHQVTGYCLAMATVLGQSIDRAYVHGLGLPLPKQIDLGGVITQPVRRDHYTYGEWFEWLLHTIQIDKTWREDPTNAPKYTHSCNRYFRPCSLIPYCGVPAEERPGIIDEMDDETWSPLDEVDDA